MHILNPHIFYNKCRLAVVILFEPSFKQKRVRKISPVKINDNILHFLYIIPLFFKFGNHLYLFLSKSVLYAKKSKISQEETSSIIALFFRRFECLSDSGVS